jgi:hypothetical protein
MYFSAAGRCAGAAKRQVEKLLFELQETLAAQP